MTSWKRMARSALVAATAAVLGFGAFTALVPVPELGAQPGCISGQCNKECRASGGQRGFCDNVGCVCIL